MKIIGRYNKKIDNYRAHESLLVIDASIISIVSNGDGYAIELTSGICTVRICGKDGTSLTLTKANDIVNTLYHDGSCDIRESGLVFYGYDEPDLWEA